MHAGGLLAFTLPSPTLSHLPFDPLNGAATPCAEVKKCAACDIARKMLRSSHE
jgi:hypothetical protein